MWIVLSYPNGDDRSNHASGPFDTQQEADDYAIQWEGPSERLEALEVSAPRELSDSQ